MHDKFGAKSLEFVALFAWSLTFLTTLSLGQANARDSLVGSGWKACSTGPWGELESLRVELDIADARFRTELLKPEAVHWYFPATTKESLTEILKGVGLTILQSEILLQPSSVRFSDTGSMVSPTDEFILGLTADHRTSLYTFLGGSPSNTYQHEPFRFSSEEFTTRLAAADLSPAIKATIRQLTYRGRDSVLFADKDLLMRSIATTAQRREAIRFLTQFHSYQMRLRLDENSDVRSLAAYWGSPSADHVEPMLRGLADMGATVGVTDLLSPFAKSRLNSYPELNTSRPLSGPDCFWTAANFFRDRPDDAFFNPQVVASFLQHEFEAVASPTYGDIALFADTHGGEPIHAAVFIADDMLFTKNGYHYWTPWVLNTKAELIRNYGVHAEVQVHYFRRKSAAHATTPPSLDDLDSR